MKLITGSESLPTNLDLSDLVGQYKTSTVPTMEALENWFKQLEYMGNTYKVFQPNDGKDISMEFLQLTGIDNLINVLKSSSRKLSMSTQAQK
eukprot:4849246-Ditylum_brightwellii.AAC.1